MSKVRVLVGTRKGAFHPYLRRQAREMGSQRPAFRRLGNLSHERLARRSQPDLRLANQRLVRPDHSALRRRRQNVEPARHAARRTDHQAPKACPKARATNSSTTRRPKPASPSPRTSGTTARSIRGNSNASGISNRRSPIRTPSMPASKMPRCSDDRRRRILARTRRPARSRQRRALAARRRRHGPAHDPARPDQSQPHLHRHLRRRCVPHRRRRQDLEADQPGLHRNTSPIPTPKSATASTASRIASVASRTCSSCRSTGTSCAATTPATSGTKSAATCRPISASRSTSTPTSRNDLRRPDQERLRPLSARRQAPRLSQQDRRQRMGAAHQGPAAGELLRQRAARRDGRRLARRLRHLLRHHRRPGLLLTRRRRHLDPHRPRSPSRPLRRSPNAPMTHATQHS